MAAWNDFRILPFSPFKPGYGFSTDGGSTWSTGVITPLAGTYNSGFDPSCSFDRNGNAFYTYIASAGFLGPVYISRTTDNGQIWDTFQVSSVSNQQDKPYMAIDNTGGSRDGRIYISWTNFSSSDNDIIFAFSTNQGSSFSEITIVSKNTDPGSGAYLSPNSSSSSVNAGFVQGSVPVVAPNGDVFVAWVDSDGGTGSTGSIRVSKSTNGGTSFGSAIVAASITVAWKENVGILRGSSFPTMAIDSNSGTIYVAYTQWDSGDLNIYYVRSGFPCLLSGNVISG